jgi:hypothetical protein
MPLQAPKKLESLDELRVGSVFSFNDKPYQVSRIYKINEVPHIEARRLFPPETQSKNISGETTTITPALLTHAQITLEDARAYASHRPV